VAIGTLAGGFVAQATNVTVPYWLAGAGMAALTATVSRRFTA
jgi:hypothetical protein